MRGLRKECRTSAESPELYLSERLMRLEVSGLLSCTAVRMHYTFCAAEPRKQWSIALPVRAQCCPTSGVAAIWQLDCHCGVAASLAVSNKNGRPLGEGGGGGGREVAAKVIGEAPVISRSKASRLCGACNCNQPTCLTMGYGVQKLINDKGHWYFLGSWEVHSRWGLIVQLARSV
jgi:hypothetical protein